MPSISIAKQLISYTIILLLSYTCSLVILCGAFSLASKVPHTHLHGKSVNPVVSSSGEAQDVSDPASMSPESVLLDVMTSPLEPLGPVKFVEPILPCYCGVCDPIPDLEPVTHHLMQMLLLEDRKKCNTNRYDGDMQEVPNATGTGYVDILRLALDFSKLKLIY